MNGKSIQNHQLTSNSGRSPYNAPGTIDLNTITINTFISCNEPQNGPLGNNGEFYVAVYSESDNYLSQNAIQKKTGRMFTRTRHGGNWSS
ncbi:pyocin knob domain-containing protein, partial [Streptococcus suis]|uniref:pyocin knob domain-containing protein n=1 Tax=Streptococcus suis TaxID=1307 RepID=UPI001EDD2572